MRYYELTCLISPNLSESELKSLQEKIVDFLQDEQGILVSENPIKPIKKKLAYPIKKMNQAYLLSFDFQLNPEKLENLKRKIMAEEKILRHLILTKKMPKLEAKLIKIPKKPAKVYKKSFQPKVELKEIEKKLEEILGE